MNFFSICGALSLSSAVILILSKKEKELSSLVSALIFIIAFIYVITKCREMWTAANSFVSLYGDYVPIDYIIKAGGIALLATVTSVICEEVGQHGIAKIAEILAVIEILHIAFPVCQEYLEKVFGVLGY